MKNNQKTKSMKNLITLLAVFMAMNLSAQDKNAKGSLEVDGVCGMCKARIEKAAIKLTGVKSVQWSVESHELKVIYDARKTNLDSIAKQVANVGHDTKKFMAPDAAYNAVNPCCKYRDEEVIKAHQ